MLSEFHSDVPSAYLRNDPNVLTTSAPVSGAFIFLFSHAHMLRGITMEKQWVGVLDNPTDEEESWKKWNRQWCMCPSSSKS